MKAMAASALVLLPITLLSAQSLHTRPRGSQCFTLEKGFTLGNPRHLCPRAAGKRGGFPALSASRRHLALRATSVNEPCNVKKLGNGYTLYQFGVEPEPEPVAPQQDQAPLGTSSSSVTRPSAEEWISTWKQSVVVSKPGQRPTGTSSLTDTRPSAEEWINAWKQSVEAFASSTPPADTVAALPTPAKKKGKRKGKKAPSKSQPSASAATTSAAPKPPPRGKSKTKSSPKGMDSGDSASDGSSSGSRTSVNARISSLHAFQRKTQQSRVQVFADLDLEMRQKKQLAEELRARRRANAGDLVKAQVKRDPNRPTKPVRFRFRTDQFLGLNADRIVEARTGDNMLEVFDNTGGIVPSFCCEGICYTCVAQMQGLDHSGNKVGDAGVVRCCITEVTEPPPGAAEIEITIPDWVKEDD